MIKKEYLEWLRQQWDPEDTSEENGKVSPEDPNETSTDSASEAARIERMTELMKGEDLND
tara:strand:- start:302 stop:481 length:180 start_codon:yes stop_codon:yes gene_type:complete